MQEQDFEDILVKYPHIIEEGLRLKGRQLVVFGRRIDLLFEDRFGRKLLVELNGIAKDTYVSPYSVATVYARLGARDQAFEWLEKGFQDRCEDLTLLKIDPRLDALRSDPRFQALLRRMNFPPSEQ